MNKRYYVNQDGGTCRRNGKGVEVCIADFHVKVTKVVIVHNIADEELFRMFHVEFHTDHLVAAEEIRSDELDKFSYAALSDELALPVYIKSAQKEMAAVIRYEAVHAPTETKTLFDKLGWHQGKNGEHYYCAGDTVISEDTLNCYEIAPSLSAKYRLDISHEMSEADAVDKALIHTTIDPQYSSILFATGLLGIMRQLILDAGIMPPNTIYLVGNSQTRKTSLARLCCQMYSRSQLANSNIGISRVNSTAFQTEALIDEYKDATYILDDLYKESDAIIKKENERRVKNALRNFADNSSRQTARSSHQNNSQLLITAEYLLESKSDLGRCFILTVERCIDEKLLTKCQNNPLALSTAYYYFIKWLCVHYEETVEKLKAGFAKLRAEAPDHLIRYERLYEQAFLLEFAFETFCDYATKVCEFKEGTISKSIYNFPNTVKKTMDYQDKIMEVVGKNELKYYNFSLELLNMLRQGFISSGEKGSECFERGDYFYITCYYFCQQLYKKYKKNFPAKTVSKYFADRFISKRDGTRNVVKYGESGQRYLVLMKDRLLEDANDPSTKIKNLFY